MKREHSISRLKLEQFVLGELSSKDARDIEVEIKSDKALELEYEKIIASNKSIFEAYPAEAMVKAIEERFEQEQAVEKKDLTFGRIVKRTIPFMGGLALAAMALFVIGPVYFSQAPAFDNGNELVYAKGVKSRMLLYLKEDGESRVVRSGEKLIQGDRLRIAYFSGEAPYGVLFSIDGRGAVTLHFPDRANELPLITTGEETLLDFSYELDDAPEFEKFYFVTSPNSFNATNILEKAEEMSRSNLHGIPGSLNLNNEFNEFSVLIQKEGQ